MNKKTRNKVALLFAFFASALFIYQIIKFPTYENLVCSGLSCFWSIVSIRYFFWKKENSLTTFNLTPFSSYSCLFYGSSYFFLPLLLGFIYSLPLDFNLTYKTLPFLISSQFYFLILMTHFLYLKSSLFFKIKKSFAVFLKNLGFAYKPSLREFILVNLFSILIFFPKISEYEYGADAVGDTGKTIYLSFIILSPSVLLFRNEYTKLYSRKVLLTNFLFFFLLFLVGTAITGKRKIVVNFCISATLQFCTKFAPSSLFLKKNLSKVFSFAFVSSLVFFILSNFFANVVSNRGKTSKEENLSTFEKITKNATETDKTYEDTLARTTELYIAGGNKLTSRLVFVKFLDNDLMYFNKIPLHLRNTTLASLREGLLTKVIPSFFYGSRENKKDISLTTGSVLDGFRYRSDGKGLRYFLEGSRLFEDFLLLGTPAFLLLFLITIPLLFAFIDCFNFLNSGNYTNSFIFSMPALLINSYTLFNKSLLSAPREVIFGVFVTWFLSYLILSFIRFTSKAFGFIDKDAILLNQTL